MFINLRVPATGDVPFGVGSSARDITSARPWERATALVSG